jgi:hypothetical protein
MKKIIFALCIISIALIGFSAVSASGDFGSGNFHDFNNWNGPGLNPFPHPNFDLYGGDDPIFPSPYPGPRQ